MNRQLTFLVLLLVLLASSACRTQRQYDLTLLSTKNSDLASEADQAKERVRGESCSSVTDVFSSGSRPMSVEGAVDEAVFQAGGEYDALVDGVILREDYFFVSCFVVEGTPAKAPERRVRRRDGARGERPDATPEKKNPAPANDDRNGGDLEDADAETDADGDADDEGEDDAG